MASHIGGINWLLRKLTLPAALSLLLGTAVFGVYWRATSYGFSHYDDLTYYVNNEHVQGGITWSGFLWASSTYTASNWHPLTWLSLMVDSDLSTNANNAVIPHFTNIFLHAINSVLLFLVLLQVTGAKWNSFLVAALFAFHPLNVESVAWIAERKNVLSLFFSLLSVWCWQCWAKTQWKENKGGSMIRRETVPAVWYWMSLSCFALALMSKPMAVTLPFVFLLLDWWPLKRFSKSDISNWYLILEKWPFFLLSAADCVVTYLAQQQDHAIASTARFPISGRMENALVSDFRYLGKAVWPQNLSIFYPHPGHWPIILVCLAAIGLVSITVTAVVLNKRFPYLLIGWFWYLGTLVPVIGLVQVGTQAMADRYAYVPLIGIFIAAVWTAEALLKHLEVPRAVTFIFCGIVLIAMVGVQQQQITYWENDGKLFGHSLAVTERNVQAEVTYGLYMETIKQSAEAEKHYRLALEIDPTQKDALFDLANLLDDAGQTEDAIKYYRRALASDPMYYPAAYNLGLILERLDRKAEAIDTFQTVLRIKPDFLAAKQHLQTLINYN